MITTTEVLNERRRLAVLNSLPNVNTIPDRQFDRITNWARREWNCPIAVIALVKESTVIFKSVSGIHTQEVRRHESLFEHSIRSFELTHVADALNNTRFSGNHFVQTEEICFYAAAPITTLEGYRLGAMCIMDRVPREFTVEQMKGLQRLAAIVSDEFEAPGYQEYAGRLGMDLLFNASGYGALAA